MPPPSKQLLGQRQPLGGVLHRVERIGQRVKLLLRLEVDKAGGVDAKLAEGIGVSLFAVGGLGGAFGT